MRKKLYIIDTSNFLHRAFHAMDGLNTSDGFPTSGIYGVYNMLLTFALRKVPENVVMCYDSQTGNSVRKHWYPLYKSNRVQVNAVSAQEMVVRKIIELLGICSVERDGYEADDLIASVHRKFMYTHNMEIVTGDKDMLQLIDDYTTVYDSMKNIYYDEEECAKKFGVRPNQIVDFLAIQGDAIDCIPGIKGIGKVGASKLLAEYGSLQNIYESLAQITGKTKEKLEKGKRDAFLSQKLAQLHVLEIPKVTSESIRFKPSPNDELLQLLMRLEFDKSIEKLTKIWDLYT